MTDQNTEIDTPDRITLKDKILRRRQKKQPDASSKLVFSVDLELVNTLSSRFANSHAFFIVMVLLAITILWSGVATASQSHQYRQDYKTLQQMKRAHQTLQVEHKRLLIEQQTFSATPQIAIRARTELNMRLPPIKNRLILKPAESVKPKSNGIIPANVSLNTGEILPEEVSQ